MNQRLLYHFAHNQYRLAMFALLAGASLYSVNTWRFRSEYSGTVHYGFLVWNLFLAWIPFIIAYFTYILTIQRKEVYIVIPIAAFFWLPFFPNAPYILTDFQHLAGKWRDLPVGYDVMMLTWFSFTGLLLRMTSLFLMQEIVRRGFSPLVRQGLYRRGRSTYQRRRGVLSALPVLEFLGCFQQSHRYGSLHPRASPGSRPAIDWFHQSFHYFLPVLIDHPVYLRSFAAGKKGK